MAWLTPLVNHITVVFTSRHNSTAYSWGCIKLFTINHLHGIATILYLACLKYHLLSSVKSRTIYPIKLFTDL